MTPVHSTDSVCWWQECNGTAYAFWPFFVDVSIETETLNEITNV